MCTFALIISQLNLLKILQNPSLGQQAYVDCFDTDYAEHYDEVHGIFQRKESPENNQDGKLIGYAAWKLAFDWVWHKCWPIGRMLDLGGGTGVVAQMVDENVGH